MGNDLLTKELDLTHDSVVNTWKVYMTWFTFFYSANLFAMSWIVTANKPFLDKGPVKALCIFWMFLNFISFITTAVMAKYTYNCCARMTDVIKELAIDKKWSNPSTPFPSFLAVMGAIFQTMALVAATIVWGYLFLKKI